MNKLSKIFLALLGHAWGYRHLVKKDGDFVCGTGFEYQYLN